MTYTRDDYIKDLFVAEHARHGTEQTNARFHVDMYEKGRAGQLNGFKSTDTRRPEQEPGFDDIHFRKICARVCTGYELNDFTNHIAHRWAGFEGSEDEQRLLQQIHHILKDIISFRKTAADYQGGSPEWNKLWDMVMYKEEELERLLTDYHSAYYKPQRKSENKADDITFRLVAAFLIILCLLPIGCAASCVLN